MRFGLPIGAVSLGVALGALSPNAGATDPGFASPEAGRVRLTIGDLSGERVDDAGSSKALAAYKAKCLVCHGPRGQGDGPGAKALNPKPRSFRDPSWQQSVSDEQIRKATTDGGAGVGKSPAMPAVPALKNDPATLDGLVALLRSFKD